MAEAKQLVHDRQYAFAIDKYKKANKIAGGKDRDSLKKLLDLQFKTWPLQRCHRHLHCAPICRHDTG